MSCFAKKKKIPRKQPPTQFMYLMLLGLLCKSLTLYIYTLWMLRMFSTVFKIKILIYNTGGVILTMTWDFTVA